MGFNATEYQESLEPPSITVDGKTYSGRLVGLHESLPIMEEYDEMIARAQGDEDTMTVDQWMDFVKRLCNLLDIPANVVLKLPVAVQQKAVESFFGSLAQPKLRSPTNGNS